MKNFQEQYEEWLAQVRDELREKGHTEEEIARAEICENGQVYFGRLSLYDITEREYVTPWDYGW